MIEEMITQAQAYISQRYLPWSLAAIGLVVGIILIYTVDHHLGKFFSKVEYDRTPWRFFASAASSGSCGWS